jgi:hypothetical protein
VAKRALAGFWRAVWGFKRGGHVGVLAGGLQSVPRSAEAGNRKKREAGKEGAGDVWLNPALPRGAGATQRQGSINLYGKLFVGTGSPSRLPPIFVVPVAQALGCKRAYPSWSLPGRFQVGEGGVQGYVRGLSKSMATIKDVAELAGVSVGTASMALSGGKVRESTRQRVLECAKRLNYVPNRIGRTLNTGKSNAIALLMMTSAKYADIVHKTSLFYYLQQGVLAVVDQANYSLRLDVKAHEDPDLLDYFERVVGDRTLDGIIIVPQYRRDYPFIYPLQQRSFPYVMMRPACFGTDVNYVDLDNSRGGQLVAHLFARRGCRRVAMINGPETHVDAIERERGFFEGLVAAGLSQVTKETGTNRGQKGD